jgi:hypothetical protein
MQAMEQPSCPRERKARHACGAQGLGNFLKRANKFTDRTKAASATVTCG